MRKAIPVEAPENTGAIPRQFPYSLLSGSTVSVQTQYRLSIDSAYTQHTLSIDQPYYSRINSDVERINEFLLVIRRLVAARPSFIKMLLAVPVSQLFRPIILGEGGKFLQNGQTDELRK